MGKGNTKLYNNVCNNVLAITVIHIGMKVNIAEKLIQISLYNLVSTSPSSYQTRKSMRRGGKGCG